MYIVWSIVAVVLSLVLVVGIHEAGHAWVARRFHVKVKRISIGFGKPLLARVGAGGCEWVWAMWPFGGYVQLLNSRIEPVSPNEMMYCFDKKPIWVRIIILLAGAGANIVVGGLALVFMFMIAHKQMTPVVYSVTNASVAAVSGLVSGDHIINIDGRNTRSWQDVGMQLVIVLGKHEVPVFVSRAGVVRQIHLDLSRSYSKNQSLLLSLGITPDLSIQNVHMVSGIAWPDAVVCAIDTLGYFLLFFIVMLKQLLLGVLSCSLLLGPLGVFMVMIDSFFQGLSVFLLFIAQLSVVVAVINLLPIPGLDGGSVVYALLEKIRGKPISIALEVLLHRLIFIVLCLVLVQLFTHDLQRLVMYIKQ